jgi:hypothetical protein
MRTSDFAPLYRSMVGFDRLFDRLGSNVRPVDGDGKEVLCLPKATEVEVVKMVRTLPRRTRSFALAFGRGVSPVRGFAPLETIQRREAKW